MKTDIPATWLNSMTTEAGGLPTLGVGRRGSRIILRTSRSVYAVSVLALVIGIGLCVTDVGAFLWVFGPPLIVGAMVAPVGVPLMNRFVGTRFEIDMSERTVTLSRRNRERLFPFDKIVALQQLNAPRSGGGQLNLVFLNDNGEIDRTCIYCHVVRRYVRRMARQFAACVPWPVVGADGRDIGESGKG